MRQESQESQEQYLVTQDHNQDRKTETKEAKEKESKGPEFFDRKLLLQPPGARQEYFEQHCLIEHPRLLEDLESIIQAICAPGEGATSRRPGTMVLVIGPSRVGKTTLVRLLEQRLLAYAQAQMRRDPHFIPLASITAPEPGSGRFDWMDYYKPVLRQLGNPFVDSQTAPIRTRQMREAMENAFLERKPLAIIVDEAHHLGKARSGRHLQDHLDHLKHFENLTGVSHILVGTYEMRPFRKVNPQLACRSIDVHFPRYDLLKEEDCQVFRSVLWALQRQLPVEQEPLLAQHHWEFLYARSIGCIGLLKLHLNRALNQALKEGARTVSKAHLHQTATADVRVKLALRNALESEAEFAEAPDADEQLLALLRNPPSRASSPSSPTSLSSSWPPLPARQEQDGRDQLDQPHPSMPSTTLKKHKPGKRAPGRDSTGLKRGGVGQEGPAEPEGQEEEQEAG